MKTKIIIGITILFLIIGIAAATDNVKPFQTTYNTTGELNIHDGPITDETGVEGNTQVLAFEDGFNKCYFISTDKNTASDLINSIQKGTKCRDGDIVWYHLQDKELVNGWGAFGSHVKVETTNDMNVGFMESPNSDEVIVLVASPDTIVDCFKSVKWG